MSRIHEWLEGGVLRCARCDQPTDKCKECDDRCPLDVMGLQSHKVTLQKFRGRIQTLQSALDEVEALVKGMEGNQSCAEPFKEHFAKIRGIIEGVKDA